MPHLAFRFGDEDGAHGQVAFAPMLNLGTSAQDNESALRFWRAVVDSQQVGFTGPLFPAELTQLRSGRLAAPDETRTKLGFLEMLYQGVVWLEDRLGVELPVHGPPISEHELAGLENALAVLHDGRVDIRVSGVLQAETERAYAQTEAQRIRNHPPFVLTVRETIFGTEVELGQAVARLPDVHVIEVPRMTGRYPSVTLRILVRGEPDVSCRLLPPGEQPLPDAIAL